MAFHRYLTGRPGDAAVIRLWVISRIAEEFHCVPQVAERLWLDDPNDTVLQIMELRSYHQAFQAYQHANGDIKKLEESPTMDLVIDHVFRLKQEDVESHD